MPAVSGGAKGPRYMRGKMLEGDQSVITVIVLGHSAFRGLFSPPCGVIPGRRNSGFALSIQYRDPCGTASMYRDIYMPNPI